MNFTFVVVTSALLVHTNVSMVLVTNPNSATCVEEETKVVTEDSGDRHEHPCARSVRDIVLWRPQMNHPDETGVKRIVKLKQLLWWGRCIDRTR